MAGHSVPYAFQSTPPVWVVTLPFLAVLTITRISIHTTRVGGDVIVFVFCKFKSNISIHTTRVGGDDEMTEKQVVHFNISIHTTRVGGDGRSGQTSTPTPLEISIHTTRVGGDIKRHRLFYKFLISIHTTRVGGDYSSAHHKRGIDGFQSTPPVWVVTDKQSQKMRVSSISIHTTRVGGDPVA